jgi:hypothetical protein
MIKSLPYSNNTTSRQAAGEACFDKVKQDRRAICDFIARQGVHGATDDELARNLPSINPNALRARRGECWGHGVITDALGEKRQTVTGSSAKVWHVTAKGIEKLGMPLDSWCVK